MCLSNGESVTGPSAIIRAAANEFASISRSIWHSQDQVDLTQTMAASPNEALLGSMATLQACAILPDAVSVPAKILHFFVTHILSSLNAHAASPLHIVLISAQAKSDKMLSHYSSSLSEAAQAKDDELSMRLLSAFKHEAGNASSSISDSSSGSSSISSSSIRNSSIGSSSSISSNSSILDAVPPGMEAENQLPPPVRRAIHSLRSLLLTLKLASFIPVSSKITWRAIHQVLKDMKDDVIRALRSFAHHTERAATAAANLQQMPASASPAEATASMQICSWSRLAIAALTANLRGAVKELAKETRAGPTVGSLVALSSLCLMNVFLHEGQPQGRHAVGEAMFATGAHSVCTCTALRHFATVKHLILKAIGLAGSS